MANQFLSLSLFLMLLSFFIVMNSVSAYENRKIQPVLNSLSMAFSKSGMVEEKTDTGAAPDPNDFQDSGEGDTLEVLEGLFNEHISGFDLKRNRLGTVMHVRLPTGRFENAVDFDSFDTSFLDRALQVQTGNFLRTMITLLRSSEKGQPYRMDIALNVPDDPSVYSQDDPSNFLVSLKYVSGLTEKLELAGMPKKMLSAGMVEGEPGMMDIYFYRYKPFTLPEEDPPSAQQQEEAP